MGFTESPISLSRYGDRDIPLPSAISPGNPFPRFGLQTQFDYRPSSEAESDRSPHPYIRGSGSSSVLSLGDDTSSVTSRSRESVDQRVSPDHDVDFPMEETGSGIRRLYIDDHRSDPYSPGATTGQKRRASSPPVDEGQSLHTAGSASDLFRRRESASRSSPTPRLHSTNGSVSSTTSVQRASSYTSSTLSIAPPSSMSSMGSYGRLSPGGLSPGGIDFIDPSYAQSVLLIPSPRGPGSRTNHQRTLSSETRPLMSSRKLSDGIGQSHGTPKIQGIFMCECCPKKPKKFDCQEDLE